ncbi:MAG TPA: nucleotidyl transferase AbiEii/AbiGii toxin family protein [Thermoanaerobaculia bacterium]|nr:nucleotidyl transferase AbiEii/AbiGii toxin family protein [Thermoanaerobaculia bacterium]
MKPALGLAHPESLSPRAQVLLGRLAGRRWAQEFYLAGAAALALYLGHRPTGELDLMSAANRLTGPERRDLLQELLALDDVAGAAAGPGAEEEERSEGEDRSDGDDRSEVETARDGYLFVRTGGVGLRFFYYPYPLVDPAAELGGLAVASAVDLGLMKLAAVISRGSRRDFVDLYLLCRELAGRFTIAGSSAVDERHSPEGSSGRSPLGELLQRSAAKFGHVRDFPLQALKGLADLGETLGEPMPRLALPLAWDEVEGWLHREVREAGRALVGLRPGGA